MKVSDYVVKFLEEHNVKDVFMVTGGGCMHLVNSFGNSKIINYICTHHEQSAAFAAEAYAKFKGDLGVVLVTGGPGGTNTITGLLGAYQDSTPCIFISGQAKRKQTVHNTKILKLRQFGVQEVNIIPIVESISKYAVMINKPEEIRYHLEKALYMAQTGRQGPVWLDIPLDVQSASINEYDLIRFNSKDIKKDYKEWPTTLEIDYVIEQLKNAKRPVIIGGHGVRLSRACGELEAFIKKYRIPVVTPIMGIDILATADENNIGKIGTKGTRAGNFAMQNADLILSIGSRLAVSVVGHEYHLFAREAKVIVIDIDIYEHQKKTIKIDKFINADAKIFLKDIMVRANSEKIAQYTTWLERCNQWKNKYPVCIPQYDDSGEGINYYKFIDVLTNRINNDTTIISDAGSAFYVVSQAAHIKKGQRYITSGAIATMGFGVPAAIGVCRVSANKPVVTITGDGSFQQNLQELAVIKYHEMPIKVFVTNNNGYLSIRQTQKKFFNNNYVGESSISGLYFPSTEKIANAYEIEYVYINTLEVLDNKLEYILKSDKPMIVEIIIPSNQQIIPTNSAYIKSDGIMISKPLEDMYPFLDRDEFYANMIISPVEE